MHLSAQAKKTLIFLVVAAAAGVAAYSYWLQKKGTGPGDGFISGNGRIEATEINVSSKYAGRIAEVLVQEGEFVQAGQAIAQMQLDSLEAQRDEAQARRRQTLTEVENAKALVAMRISEVAAAEAEVVRARSDFEAAKQRLGRSSLLAREGAASRQELDDDQAAYKSREAGINSAQAKVVAAKSAVHAAETQVSGAEAAVQAAQASVARIEADIKDSMLITPRSGRVQYRVHETGEVIAAGSPVVNLIDLADVYMTFFVPEAVAGRVAIGSEARIVVDAAADRPIPATISFVASQAQFTPKTVETASERQKFMFRVRAQISPDLLQKYYSYVKTGMPGVAWIKLDPEAAWPAALTEGIVE